MPIRFRDNQGNDLRLGDTVLLDALEAEAKYIGRIVMGENGQLMIRREKKFSARTLGFEPMELKAVNQAYDRPLVPGWHGKIYWALRGWRLQDVQLLRRGSYGRRPAGFDAPLPYLQ